MYYSPAGGQSRSVWLTRLPNQARHILTSGFRKVRAPIPKYTHAAAHAHEFCIEK
jgi:hypothetical protein